ncbi:MAG: dienelactone hydrolase family protein [Candidatus Eisenbacteria bacterium]
MKGRFVLLLAALAGAASGIVATVSHGAIHTETVEYRQGDTALEGYLAYDDAKTGKRPGILVVHDWLGVGPYVKHRCEMLAQLGYAAFAPDIYGKGIRPKGPEDAAKVAGIYAGDRDLMRARAKAGLEKMESFDVVDPSRVAAIGYCFGGGVALELARSGADLDGVVTFHGTLDTPRPAKPGEIKAKVLVLHGADDPYVPLDQVHKLIDELKGANVDWEVNLYSHAVHSFTIPDAGNDPSKGAAYDEEADHRSWEAMRSFFGEIFP